MSLDMYLDNELRDEMEDATSSLPRKASTWTHCYCIAMNIVGRLDGFRKKPGNATPCPKGLRKSQEFNIFFSFMVLIVANSCALWSPRVQRVQTFQHAIMVLDLGCKSSTS